MNNEEIIRQLRGPFGSRDIEWKIQATTQDKSRGMAVAYVDARAVQKRLDDVIGPFNWKNVYSLWHDNSQICGISIFNTDRNEWVTKFDGAENSDFEPIKGGLSDSFKRAAIVWGIGRYLYEMEGVWVGIEAKGKSFAIRQEEYGKLEKEYNALVTRITGQRPNQGPNQGSNQRPSQQSAPAGQAVGAPAVQKADTMQPSEPSAYDYKVHTIRPSGKSSQMVELVDKSGGMVKAYIRTADQSIRTGTFLSNVRIEKKNGAYGDYNVINGYQIAA